MKDLTCGIFTRKMHEMRNFYNNFIRKPEGKNIVFKLAVALLFHTH
jgi:NADH:ubiquinone oxidoreductase subunit E